MRPASQTHAPSAKTRDHTGSPRASEGRSGRNKNGSRLSQNERREQSSLRVLSFSLRQALKQDSAGLPVQSRKLSLAKGYAAKGWYIALARGVCERGAECTQRSSGRRAVSHPSSARPERETAQLDVGFGRSAAQASAHVSAKRGAAGGVFPGEGIDAGFRMAPALSGKKKLPEHETCEGHGHMSLKASRTAEATLTPAMPSASGRLQR